MKNLWMEFAVATAGDTSRHFCGLCGNHGLLVIGTGTTPAGVPLEIRREFCICPNGRAMKANGKAPDEWARSRSANY